MLKILFSWLLIKQDTYLDVDLSKYKITDNTFLGDPNRFINEESL